MNYFKGIVMGTAFSILTLGGVVSTPSYAEEQTEVKSTVKDSVEYQPLSSVEREEKLANLNYDEKTITSEQIINIDDETLAALDPNGELIAITSQESFDLGYNPAIPALMPTSDFSMSTYVQRIKDYSATKYDNFQFTATGKGHVNRNYEFEDTIALAWSDSFTLYHDESMHYTSKDGHNFYYSGTRNKATVETGVGHNIDLKVGQKDIKSTILAKVYASNRSGEGNVVGEYGHVQLSARDITLSFTGGAQPNVGFSIGVGASVNTASPAYSTFKY